MSYALEVPTPFGDPVKEVPLSSAPLIAVVAQITFPPIVSIAREEFIGPFQERVRAKFPVLRQESEMSVVLTPQGPRPGGDPSPVWRFLDRPKNPEWKISLAPSFVALDCSQYTSRADFIGQLHFTLQALQETVNPATCDRIGLRYVDRVELPEGVDLSKLVRSEVLGVTDAELGGGAEPAYSLSDTEYRLANSTMHGRWGWVPPNTQLDPLHGAAVNVASWILDLDMYSTNVGDFDVEPLVATTESFAERIYRFFRWAAKPELLRHYGGEV